MLSNLTSLLAAAEPLGEIDAWAVVLGVGIVFCGLVIIILVCYLMGILAQEKPVTDTTVAQPEEPVEQKVLIEAEPEVVVALSAVIAEDMGVDATDFRIISIEKI